MIYLGFGNVAYIVILNSLKSTIKDEGKNMKKLQIIIIVFLISFSICTFASMQAKACTTSTYTASISPTLTDAGLTGVPYTITFTYTGSSNMGSGTITIPTKYTTVSLTSVTASNGDPWSGSVSSPTISFTASHSDDEISNGQTVKVVFSATNPSSANSYTWKTTAYSGTSEGGTAFTISGSQPIVTVDPALSVSISSPTSPVTMDAGQSETFTATASGGSTDYTGYQWYLGGSQVTGATSQSWTYTPSSAASSTPVTVTVTDSNGWTSAKSPAVSVTVDSALIVSVPSSLTVDVGQSVASSASVSGGTNPYTYQWYFNSVLDSSQTGSSYSCTATTTDLATDPITISVIATDAAGNAVSSNTETITVDPALTVSIPSSATVDVGQLYTVSATASGGAGSNTYAWYFNGILDPTQTGSSYSYTATTADQTNGYFTLSVTITDAAGNAVSSNTETITVNQLTITVTQTANGLISPGTSPVSYGATPTFTITPNTGYHIASITANGASVTVITPTGQSYQFSAVLVNGSLTATFAITTSTTTTTTNPTTTTTNPTTTTTNPTTTTTNPTTTTTNPTTAPTATPSPTPSPTPLYLVLVAVIIIAAIILISTLIAIKRRKRKPD